MTLIAPSAHTYSVVDYTKFVFAICIVGIHSGVLEGSLIYPLLFRLAVPYFFIASGFFLGGKLFNHDKNAPYQWKRVFKRLAIKLIVFEPISIFLVCVLLIKDGTSVVGIIKQVVQHILFYPYGALWYIQALIVSFAILIPLSRKVKLSYILMAAFVLYLFALICNNYYFVASHCGISNIVNKYLTLFISPRNGLFVGLFYVTIGLIIRKYENRILMVSRILLSGLLILSYGLLIAEACFLNGRQSMDDGSLFISYCCVIPLVFIFTISFKQVVIWNSLLFRNLSTSIYLIHRPLLMLWPPIFMKAFGYTLSPVEALVLTLIIAILLSLLGYRSKRLYKILV